MPENLFIIAACNPHRGNSLILESDEFSEPAWIRGNYYVKDLHPTLKCLMWDFGSLTETEEKSYVASKIKMITPGMLFPKQIDCDLRLTTLIVKSQELIREFAKKFIRKSSGANDDDSFVSDCATSCVSQRDIQRVFDFFFWLRRVYAYRKTLEGPSGLEHPEQRAILVALGLVYYLRLDSEHRKEYVIRIDKVVSVSETVSFMEAFDDDINWLISKLHIPNGIAKTRTLKENLFATIVCACTKTPLIVVGKPGTSKTLSFNLAIDNLKGDYSHSDVLRNPELFPALDPLVYQCSKQTTSLEIDNLFKFAITRQQSYSKGTNCVFFMDEAGLPQERHESLKILHSYLDEHKVSFVAISNHILDAAKTNRAVSLVVPETTEEDLRVLVEGCYAAVHMSQGVTKYCSSFIKLISIKEWKNMFGLRDFIHFIHYLHSKEEANVSNLVLRALERNFNGLCTNEFDAVCKVFLQSVSFNISYPHVLKHCKCINAALELGGNVSNGAFMAALNGENTSRKFHTFIKRAPTIFDTRYLMRVV